MDHYDHRRIQRREFRDFQPLSLLVAEMDIVEPQARRDFLCITGPIWKRYNAATVRSAQRRLTALFLSNEANTFERLLFVGCDTVRRRRRSSQALWAAEPFAGLDARAVEHICIDLRGRSVITFGSLAPFMAGAASPPADEAASRPRPAGATALAWPSALGVASAA